MPDSLYKKKRKEKQHKTEMIYFTLYVYLRTYLKFSVFPAHENKPTVTGMSAVEVFVIKTWLTRVDNQVKFGSNLY